MTGDGAGRRLGAAAVSRGMSRRLSATPEATPSPQELDHQLGFDLGYRDGLARATAEVETAAIEARVAWESAAQARMDEATAALESAQAACRAAAEAMADACADERAWATRVATELAYAAVIRFLGDRHASKELMGALCATALEDVHARPILIRIAPADYDSVAPHVGSATVEADDRLLPGACELDTPRGRVVAGVAERLTLLRDAWVASLVDGDPERRA